jgi:glutathione S-transferase
MTEEPVLYTHPMSRGRIARWMLEEVGEPYRAEILEFAGSMKSPEYMALNPMGKAPALRQRSGKRPGDGGSHARGQGVRPCD